MKHGLDPVYPSCGIPSFPSIERFDRLPSAGTASDETALTDPDRAVPWQYLMLLDGRHCLFMSEVQYCILPLQAPQEMAPAPSPSDGTGKNISYKTYSSDSYA